MDRFGVVFRASPVSDIFMFQKALPAEFVTKSPKLRYPYYLLLYDFFFSAKILLKNTKLPLGYLN